MKVGDIVVARIDTYSRYGLLLCKEGDELEIRSIRRRLEEPHDEVLYLVAHSPKTWEEDSFIMLPLEVQPKVHI